ncbi:hypothetical protein MMC28_007504 [Mycoblastus sanguinarius]|nr:hypothetical protein [Mycoblastus sanguinarius]
MLLISLCQLVVASFEKVVSGFETQQQALEGSQNADEELDSELGVDKASLESSHATRLDSFLRSYRIDVAEQTYVFGALVRLQISKWKTFVTQLESAVLRLSLDTQSSMLQDIIKRVCTQQDICTRLLLDHGNMSVA